MGWFIGALVGGAISGIGSYLGGIRGARQSYDLLITSQKESAKRALIIEIKYTLNKLDRMDPNGFYGAKNLGYDEHWKKHLFGLENLSQEEFADMINWFLTVFRCQQNHQTPASITGSINSNKVVLENFAQLRPKIETLLQKLEP